MEILNTQGLTVGQSIQVIAYCSGVDVLNNVTAVGSYREVYHLNGVNRAFMEGVIFKNSGVASVDVEAFTDVPVLVSGTVGMYKDALQLSIAEIRSLKGTLDPSELLINTGDQELINKLTDLMYESESNFVFKSEHYRTAKGMTEKCIDEFVTRMYKFLSMTKEHYAEEFNLYKDNISLIVDYILNTECTTVDKINVLSVSNTPFMVELLFRQGEYPEYEEFVQLHQLVMKLKG